VGDEYAPGDEVELVDGAYSTEGQSRTGHVVGPVNSQSRNANKWFVNFPHRDWPQGVCFMQHPSEIRRATPKKTEKAPERFPGREELHSELSRLPEPGVPTRARKFEDALKAIGHLHRTDVGTCLECDSAAPCATSKIINQTFGDQ
jgi:hypothetical protein